MGLIKQIDKNDLDYYKEIELTISQKDAYNQVMCLLQEFDILIIGGEMGVGKYTTSMKVLSTLTDTAYEIDFFNLDISTARTHEPEIIDIINEISLDSIKPNNGINTV